MLFRRYAISFSVLVRADIVSQKTPSNLANQQQQISDRVGEMDEGSSQDSSKESMCSLPEFDIGDETMASQETTATEVTSAAEPTATQVRRALTLRIMSLTACSMLKHFVCVYALLCSKFRRIKRIYQCPNFKYPPTSWISCWSRYQSHHRR